MGVRTNFYTALCDEFRDHPPTSFLFRHLREKRKNEFSHAPLGELLGFLERMAGRKQKLRLTQTDQDWLWALGEYAGGADFREMLEHTRGEKAQCKRVLDALRSHPEAVSGQELAKLREVVLNMAVNQDARTFLYDAGFSPDREEVYPHRKKDHTLEILDAWCDEMGFTLRPEGAAGSTGALTDEERRAWDTVIQQIQKKKEATGLILPVRVDARTGVGLYLAGIECFTPDVKKEIAEKYHQKYAFLCLAPTDFSRDEDAVKAYETVDYQLVNRFLLTMSPLTAAATYCVTLRSGEDQLSYILQSRLVCQFISEHNSLWWTDADLKSTPKPLRKFFQAYEQSDWAALVEEGRQESARDMARNPGTGF